MSIGGVLAHCAQTKPLILTLAIDKHQEGDAEGSEVQGYPQLHSLPKACLGYMRSFLKGKAKTQEQTLANAGDKFRLQGLL